MKRKRESETPVDQSRRDFLQKASLGGLAGAGALAFPGLGQAQERLNRLTRAVGEQKAREPVAITGSTTLADGHRHTYTIELQPDGTIIGSTDTVNGHSHNIQTTLEEIMTDLSPDGTHLHTLEPQVAVDGTKKTWGETLEITGGPFAPSTVAVSVKDEHGRAYEIPAVEVTPTSLTAIAVPLRGHLLPDEAGPNPNFARLEVTTASLGVSEAVDLEFEPPVVNGTPDDVLQDVVSAADEERSAFQQLRSAVEERLATTGEVLDAKAQRRYDELMTALDKLDEEFAEVQQVAQDIGPLPDASLAVLTMAAAGTRAVAQEAVVLAQAIPDAGFIKAIETIILCITELVGIATIQVVVLKVMMAVCALVIAIPIIGELICALTVMVASFIHATAVVVKFIRIIRHIEKIINC